MGQVQFDTDELAARIRNYLNVARYALAAAKADAEVDYRDGLMSAAAARELATVVYAKVRAVNDVQELSRFSALNKETADMITQFWESLGVITVRSLRPSTGETRNIAITPADQPKKPVIRQVNKAKRKPFTRISDTNMVDMIEYFMAAEDKKHTVTNSEFTMLAEKYKVSNPAIYARYQTFKSGRYNDVVEMIREKNRR